MSRSADHGVFGLCISVFAIGLVLVCQSPQTTFSQVLTGAPDPELEELRRQVDNLQGEVRQLRERDVQRQAWEESITRRLPAINARYASENLDSSYYGGLTAPDCGVPPTPSPGCSQQPGCSAGCANDCCCGCGCYPCECPLPEAPCIKCPRVSTLNPYINVHLFGAVVTDMLFNEARPISPGAPYYLSPASPMGRTQNTVDIHARSSYLGAAITGPQMGSFQAGGMAMVFFYNDNVLADQYGILPVQMWGDLKNDYWRFAAGLQFDVFNPGIPTMLAFSALSGSGNVGNAWRGQFRVERFIHLHDEAQWTIQTAVSEPITSAISPVYRTLSEDNGWPNFEGRVALGLGPLQTVGMEAKRPFEIGLSGVVGQLRTTPAITDRVVTDVWGAGIDLRWQVTDWFGFMGELYTGQALGTYNGGVLQNVNVDTHEGIRSAGGWGEVFVYWTPCLHSHFGYAIDDPNNADLSPDPDKLQRELNETIFANLIWDLNQAFRIGFELTYRETENTSAFDNTGMGYHTQVRWSF